MSTTTLALIPLLPLLAAALTCALQNGRRAAGVAIVAMLASCGLALSALKEACGMKPTDDPLTFDFEWLTVGNDTVINFGFVLDPLTGVMAAMVTFVGLLIFIYSAGYMKEDERMARFFCYLSLFAAGMLGLVLVNNLLLLFMCWEIVGVASYLLISFWFHKPEAAAAGKKAFIVTRIGDMGFLIGILLAFKTTGTLTLYDGGQGLLELPIGATVLGLKASAMISLLLFMGAVGKSGQLPLHVWLPDAMEGPTPVSALIHAATMVAAGVFLVARTMPLFENGGTLPVVAWTGAITALIAAFIALGQYDIKRILAYSTVSQLGLMMVGLGVGGVAVGMFHLLTHAFFKALLFLGAGSIIHGCHEEQDIRKMGGIWKPMRVTSIAYLCGTAALVALPFVTSGYYSKDQILAAAWEEPLMRPVFWIAAAASLLTAVYMTRQCLYVFAGEYRGCKTPHESPVTMTTPLVILALFALGMGMVLEKSIFAKLQGKLIHDNFVIAVSMAVALGGIALGWLIYRGRALGQAADPLAVTPLVRKLWFDELYAATVGRLWALAIVIFEQLNELLHFVRDLAVLLADRIGNAFAVGGDRKLIDTLAFDGMCNRLRSAGHAVTRPQNGFLPGYLRLIALGAVALGLLVSWMK
ncbi:MAG: NADH-quinone oxidoreductase subunit L [Verrucomicrobiota bacterium]|jgi:NADH-quinone oxidoreductase subunit L|nr:NADH-quinone oxidoreductase subunit L [Verrucomicrobiota bacterium]MDP7176716.1 NADH-quinone oxidoreductase subunit L [Verrucomicrobiota bacterium]MDP7291241.1 NADH-quinone oxidoreductase subunit L [Verrucomicrobiota bacterium]MDP7440275.1 NADH-quinone oxidoreductase subunit L [Verrucomicrobiota bacterium]|tara:strand:- start:210 stop:2129 length:1920 start_codon:yes stop_codon:yes gene_type:complete